MPVDKINVWEDPRVQKRSAHLNGRTYGYLYGEPKEGYRATVFLLHGYPDLSVGWRYQIPMLLSLGLRVVVPDCMGYGRTDAPRFQLRDYGFKRVSDDMAELAKQLGADRIILGGHDWGGFAVYRVALYHPQLITALFSICTPYNPPTPTYNPLLLLTRSTLPNFAYQHQFGSGVVEEAIQSRTELKNFLNAVYGGKPPANSPPTLDPYGGGVRLTDHEKFDHTPLLSEEELEYYAQEYARHGMHAPCNWYRTREINWEDEYKHFFKFGEVKEAPSLEQEVLFVGATNDGALPPDRMAKHMVEGAGVVPNLRRRDVDTGHWVLWEAPEELNGHVREWLEEVVLKGKDGSKL